MSAAKHLDCSQCDSRNVDFVLTGVRNGWTADIRTGFLGELNRRVADRPPVLVTAMESRLRQCQRPRQLVKCSRRHVVRVVAAGAAQLEVGYDIK
jgi:hypothetical protein